MRTDYLAAIADMLEDDTLCPEEQFAIGHWEVTIPRCGTVRCAIGWAIHHKIIPDLVLTYKNGIPENRKTGSLSFPAISEALKIDSSLTHRLFTDSGYYERPVTRQHVANRIRKLLKENP